MLHTTNVHLVQINVRSTCGQRAVNVQSTCGQRVANVWSTCNKTVNAILSDPTRSYASSSDPTRLRSAPTNGGLAAQSYLPPPRFLHVHFSSATVSACTTLELPLWSSPTITTSTRPTTTWADDDLLDETACAADPALIKFRPPFRRDCNTSFPIWRPNQFS